MSKKIILITDEPDSEAVKNAVKMLVSTGDYAVQVEEPDATSVLHIALGILSPTKGGFSGATAGGEAAPEGGKKPDGEGEEKPEDDEDDIPDATSDFSFESLGSVAIDGELVEAVLNPKAKTSILEAVGVSKASNRMDYMLNESKFAFYVQPDASGMTVALAEHRITVNNQSALATFALAESKTDKPRLIVGTDYKRLFA